MNEEQLTLDLQLFRTAGFCDYYVQKVVRMAAEIREGWRIKAKLERLGQALLLPPFAAVAAAREILEEK